MGQQQSRIVNGTKVSPKNLDIKDVNNAINVFKFQNAFGKRICLLSHLVLPEPTFEFGCRIGDGNLHMGTRSRIKLFLRFIIK